MPPVVEAMLITVSWLFFIGIGVVVLAVIGGLCMRLFDALGAAKSRRDRKRWEMRQHMAGDHRKQLTLRERWHDMREDAEIARYRCDVCNYSREEKITNQLRATSRTTPQFPKILS